MSRFSDCEEFPDSFQKGMAEALERMNRAFINGGVRRAVVHDRANEAKEDYLNTIPGALYRLMKEDIASVWSLLESPIEQVAIFQLAAENFGRENWPIYAKVCKARGLFSHKHYPVQIIPQVTFGPFRVDFLFDLGARGLLACECDGEEFHQDWRRDFVRDQHLFENYNIQVMRLQGKHLWRDNSAAVGYADLVRSYLT